MFTPALLCVVVLAAPWNQYPPVNIVGWDLTEVAAPVEPDAMPLAEPVQDGPQEQKTDAPDEKPPTPAHTGFRALLVGLKDDITHLPARQNLYLAGIGGGLALGAHAMDQTVNTRLQNPSDIGKAIFAPGKYFGDTPEQMALSIGTWPPRGFTTTATI